jgi:hypothetical protein
MKPSAKKQLAPDTDRIALKIASSRASQRTPAHEHAL